jgi:photosystem II stability/assembly factor-like uncharacterized protein
VSGWTRLSVRPGGTVAGLAVSGNQVFAATLAGVYRSSDGGFSWSAGSTDSRVPFCEAIAAQDQTIFVGGRHGLHRSDDGGSSWRQLLSSDRVLGLAVTCDLLLVGTEQDGILRSEDGGRTFAPANAGLLDLSVLALALSPEFERDGIGFAATSTGVYRTRNSAKSWRSLDLDAAVQCVLFSPQAVFAGTEVDGLFRSEDAGAHWESIANLRGRSVTAMTRSGGNTLAAATDAGVAVSEDGGASWRMTATQLGPVLSLAFTPAPEGEVLLAGLHRNGVARATRPFDDWTRCNSGLDARLLLGLTVSPAFEVDQTLVAAGPDDGVLISRDAGQTWTAHLNGAEDPLVFSVACAPDGRVFVSTEAGVLRSRDRGPTWELVNQARSGYLLVEGPVVLVAKGDSLVVSDDGGDSWRGTGEAPGGEVVSIASAPDGALFAGTASDDELTLWRMVSGGGQWERWLVHRRDGDVLPVAAIDDLVYAGIGSRVLSPIPHTREVRAREQRPIWRSVDLSAAVTGLAAALHFVFAATSNGVYVSGDRGEHFTRWSGHGNGPRSTVAIAVSPNLDVYALEMGGTIWHRLALS